MNTAIILHKALIRSIFNYGSIVYYPSKDAANEELEKIQFQGLRTAMGYRLSTPKM